MIEVPGYGSSNAKILILGEAPAVEEVKLGKPFQGRAGQQLDSMLHTVGIDRDKDCYLTNASLSPVSGDKAKFFFQSNGAPTETFVRGLQQLALDIRTIRPNVVLALGNYALWAMMQHQAIMKWRGSILWSSVFDVKVIPTIHPAALLRGQSEEEGGTKGGGGMWKMLTPVIYDLRRAKAQSAFRERRLRHREVIINPEGVALDECIATLMEAPSLVFDMETFGGTRLACAGFSTMDPERAYVLECDNNERIGIIRDVLQNPKSRKIGHNICSYDVPMLDTVGIRTDNVHWDTIIAQHILTPDLPKSLAFLTSVYTDMPYYKDEGKILGKIRSKADMVQAMLYCGKDNLSCAEIALEQPELLQERGLMPVMDRSMKIFGPLRQAMNLGFKCDLKKLYLLATETEKKLKLVEADLFKEVGHSFNYNSHVQVKQVVYGERGIAPRKKDGKVTSDAHVLADIAARTGDAAPRGIIEARQLSKLLSNYYNLKVLSPDGRIRTVFNIPGTASKRLSSSIPLWGPGVPMQTIPSRARQAYIADDGWEILECDQAQAEAVVVAYLANDPIHMDCFRTGKDVHRVTAALLNGTPVEDWEKIPKNAAIRDLAKTCNHELNYYAKAFMFMLTVNEKYDPDDPNSVKLDPETAGILWHRYHEIRPALAGYWEMIRKELRDNRMTLRSPLGWEYAFLDKWSDSLLRLAYSWKPQSTVGEATNIGILQVFGLMDPPSTLDHSCGKEYQEAIRQAGVKLLAQVHDSAAFLIPKDRRDLIPMIMALLEVPLYINGYNIVIPIEGMVGANWYKGDMESCGKTRKTVEI